MRFIPANLFLLCLLSIKAYSQQGIVSLQVDNDIFNLLNQTDRYYTSGLDVQVAVLPFNGFVANRILLGGMEGSSQLSGLSFQQKIYTPIDIYTEVLQEDDRPYASMAILNFERFTVSVVENYRIKSSFGLGLIGKNSGGEMLQNFVHAISPYSENANGWHNQISHDLLVDYQIELEKGLLTYEGIQFNLFGAIQAGTLVNKASTGLNLSLGIYQDYFKHPIETLSDRRLSARVFSSLKLDYVFYDATLQGGLFNSNSTYIIASNELNKDRITFDFGAEIGFGLMRLQVGRSWQNAEFNGAQNHGWGYLKLVWFLN